MGFEIFVKVRRRFLSNGLLVVSATLLALPLVEAGLFVYFRSTPGPGSRRMVDEYRSPFVWELAPSTTLSEGGFDYVINNLGMRRNADVPEVAAQGTRRILSYGDSIARGRRVELENTYAHLLESALSARGIEILNMFRGSSPTIASFHIRHDAPRLEPTGVIFEIELLNDTADEAMIRTEGRDEHGLPRKLRTARYVLDWDDQLLAPILLTGSFLERTKTWALASQTAGKLIGVAREGSVKRSVDPLFSDDSGIFYYNLGFDRFRLTETALEQGFERMFESLRGIQGYLQERDVRFLLVILPSQYAFIGGPFQHHARKQVRRAEGRAAELGLDFVSLEEPLREAGGATLFMDFCHPNGDGNRAIADALLPLVGRW